MPDLTRRTFLQIVASSAAVSLAPLGADQALANGPVPILWGDGVHDDADALEAFAAGAPVEFATAEMASRCTVDEDKISIVGGVFRVTRSLHFPGPRVFVLEGMEIAFDCPLEEGMELLSWGENRVLCPRSVPFWVNPSPTRYRR